MNRETFEKMVIKAQSESYRVCDRLLSKPIVIIPAGRFYQISIIALKRWGIEIEAIGDKNPYECRNGNKWRYGGREYIVKNTSELLEKYKNSANYIITSRPFRKEIETELLSAGISKDNIFHTPVRLGNLVPENSFMRRFEINRAFDDIVAASNLLYDDESKDQLWKIISIFYADAPVWFEELPSEEYFNTPYIKIEQNEIFVDAGMYDGRTSERFIELCPSYAGVIGIEANPTNMQNIKTRLNKYKNVSIYNNALCDSESVLRFGVIGGEGAKISDEGEMQVQGIIGDKLDIRPTFMKFDIEGAEYDALIGFKETIQKYKPKMAISAYHSLRDHWRLIRLINDICPDYKLYLKHHYGYEDLYGTILYAVVDNNE